MEEVKERRRGERRKKEKGKKMLFCFEPGEDFTDFLKAR